MNNIKKRIKMVTAIYSEHIFSQNKSSKSFRGHLFSHCIISSYSCLQKSGSDIYIINDNSEHDEIKKRINMIGDEFVRKQFMDLYYKKINIPNQVEVLQERVKELENELKNLKSQTHVKEGSE